MPQTYTRDQIANKMRQVLDHSMATSVSGVSSIVSNAKRAYEQKHKKEMSIASQAVLAQSFKVMQDRLVGLGKSFTEINSAAENLSDVSNPISMLFSIMSVVIPNMAYSDVVGLQPLPTAISPIFYPLIKTNESRNNVAKGTTLLGSSGWETSNTYSTNKYTKTFASQTGTTVNLTLDYPTDAFTVNPGSVVIKVVEIGSVFWIQENGEGQLVPNTAVGFTSGTIDYDNHTLALNFATDATRTIEVTYRYSSEMEPAQVILAWETKPVRANPYRLRSSYNIDNFMAAKQVLNGYDIDEVLSTGLAGIINKEISCGVFDDLRARADSNFTFSKTAPAGVPWTQHRYQVLQSIVESANYIRSKVARAAGNVLVSDEAMTNLLETFGDDVFKLEKYEREPIGPYREGTLLGRIKVIKNLDFGNGGSTLTYKLDDLDASMLGGAFIQLYATDPLSLDTLKTVQGFGTQVGFTKTYDGSVSRITITE